MNASDLKDIALLVEFNDEDRLALAELLESRSLVSGRSLFCEGDEADALFFVVSGCLRLSTRASGELGLLCAGAWLGAISLMTIGVREATARAQDDCEILFLTRPAFRRLVEDAPATACRLSEAIVCDLATGLRPHLRRVEQALSSDDVVISG